MNVVDKEEPYNVEKGETAILICERVAKPFIYESGGSWTSRKRLGANPIKEILSEISPKLVSNALL